MFFFVHRLSIAIQSFGRFLHIRLQLECNKPPRNPPTCTGWSEWCPLEWPLRGALETTTRRQFFRPIFRSVHLLACLCVLGFHRSRDMRIDSHYHIDALPVNWFALLPPPWRLELFAMFHHSHGFCWPLWEEHSSKDCSCGPLCWGFFVLCCAHCLQGLGVCRKLGGFRDDWHDHWKIADQYMCIYIYILYERLRIRDGFQFLFPPYLNNSVVDTWVRSRSGSQRSNISSWRHQPSGEIWVAVSYNMGTFQIIQFY